MSHRRRASASSRGVTARVYDGHCARCHCCRGDRRFQTCKRGFPVPPNCVEERTCPRSDPSSVRHDRVCQSCRETCRRDLAKSIRAAAAATLESLSSSISATTIESQSDSLAAQIPPPPSLLSSSVSVSSAAAAVTEHTSDREHELCAHRWITNNKTELCISIMHHFLMAARRLTDAEVVEVRQTADALGEEFPRMYPTRQISPKLHIMFIHIPEFAEKYRTIGLFSESPFESMHGEFNRYDATYACIDDNLKQLELSFNLSSLKHDVRIPPHERDARICPICQLPIKKAEETHCQCPKGSRVTDENTSPNTAVAEQ